MTKGKQRLSSKISKMDSDMERLDIYFDEEEDLFSQRNINVGKPIASFSFGSMANPINEELISQRKTVEEKAAAQSPSSNNHQTNPKGQTPVIDGEYFTLKRCYQFRPSTIRKLNELKAKHPDVNAYLNTILDEAIMHYYNYKFSGEKAQNSSNQIYSYIDKNISRKLYTSLTKKFNYKTLQNHYFTC